MLIAELMKDLTDDAEIKFYHADYYSGESMSCCVTDTHTKSDILANPYFKKYEPEYYNLDIEHNVLEIVD